ncbi:MAG: hypothetical protein K9H15_14630 [Bacteroidales bacterium]|nr:hypothetical protein [Bacteroidales bacterium]
MRKTLTYVFWTVFVVGCLLILGFANKKHNGKTFVDYEIGFSYPGESILIDTANIQEVLSDLIYSLQARKITEVKLREIEDILLYNPYISEAEAWISFQGRLKIMSRQREPILRMIDAKNKSYYMDESGNIFPYQLGYLAHVPVASGNIKPICIPAGKSLIEYDSISDPDLKNLFELARQIDLDDFLNAQIAQIYFNGSNEIELIPKFGKHLIEFGDFENITDKLDKLIIFYKQGMGGKKWKRYKKINLKYKNQVVCTKI